MILECCSKSLLCVCHLPARTCVPVQGDLEFPRSLPIPGMLWQILSRWCLNTGLGQGWEGREGAFPAGDTRSKQDLCATECQLGFVPLRGVSRMLFPRDVQRLLRGLTPTRGATVKREPANSQHHPGICSLAHPPLLAVGMIQLGHGWSSAALLWDLGCPRDTGTRLQDIPHGFCSPLPAARGEKTKTTLRCCVGPPGVLCPSLGSHILCGAVPAAHQARGWIYLLAA